MTDAIEDPASEFAEDLRALLTAFVGSDVPFEVEQHQPKDGRAAQLVIKPAQFVVLKVRDRNLISLDISFYCQMDQQNEFLVVAKSKVAVHAGSRPDGEPMVRFEYERSARNKPVAHLQVHAHSDRFTTLMTLAKGEKRKQSQDPFEATRLAALHFPMGGHRFRPGVEDVLEMVEREFGAKPSPTWKWTRDALRAKYRRAQTAAAVRDCPSAAVSALERLGFSVKWPDVSPCDRNERLTAY